MVKNFWKLATTFVGGCAQAFDIPVPGLGITFFQLFVGVLIIDVIISSVYIILGVHTDSDGSQSVYKEYGIRGSRGKISKAAHSKRS